MKDGICLIYNEDPLLRNYEKGIVLSLFTIDFLEPFRELEWGLME